ncbi:hypothetical protein EON82_03410 [bacterium]|nr:MAG: hypothetical protein EON82_03410 [bacterium]
MPERIYSRFAQISLDLFRDEESFPIEVPDGQDLDLTVEAFRELDCAVEVGPKHNWITVTCPRP